VTLRLLVWHSLLCAAAVAQQRPFSHKLHLQLKMQCVTCHTAAPSSTKASDNLMPAEKICLSCHKTAAIPAPPVLRVDKFNHQLHLKLGNAAPVIAAAIDSGAYLSPPGGIRSQLNTKNQCEACHRGMEVSEAVSRTNMPQMADCLVCHKEIEVPFSCEKCHDNVESLKPASHTELFIEQHSTGKAAFDKASCAVCHGRTFRCMGCH
jgi:predicted CXXCH cytochrome family protein